VEGGEWVRTTGVDGGRDGAGGRIGIVDWLLLDLVYLVDTYFVFSLFGLNGWLYALL
jgi:hypothetical protein